MSRATSFKNCVMELLSQSSPTHRTVLLQKNFAVGGYRSSGAAADGLLARLSGSSLLFQNFFGWEPDIICRNSKPGCSRWS